MFGTHTCPTASNESAAVPEHGSGSMTNGAVTADPKVSLKAMQFMQFKSFCREQIATLDAILVFAS